MSRPILFAGKSPSPKDLKDGTALASWIEGFIPCYEPPRPIPMESVTQILKVINRHSVSAAIVTDAFSILHEKGVLVFIPAIKIDPKITVKNQNQSVRANTHSHKQMREARLDVLENQFQLAVVANNEELAAEILVAVLELLWSAAKQHSKALKNRDAMDRWFRESLRGRRSLSAHIRHLTQAELNSLRHSPTPDGLRRDAKRLAKKAIRSSRSQRRSRRRAR